jgi:hypothetical protein
MALVTLPRQYTADVNGEPRVGARLFVYNAGTNNTRTVYTTKAYTIEHSQPIQSVEGGLFPAIYVNPAGGDYKVVIQDDSGASIYSEDNISPPIDVLTPQTITALLPVFARTPAEISSSVVPADLSYPSAPYDVRRAGILPNDSNLRTQNTEALKALLDPTKTGIRGRVVFPNTTGNDVYYLGDMVQIRENVHLDLMGCTLNFSKSYATSDDTMGFFTLIKDVTLENGAIVVTYTGSGTENPGSILRIGSRSGTRFGSYTSGIFDEDNDVQMGNIVVRNMRLSTTNPNVAAVLMLGGLDGVLMENIELDGGGEASVGILYEYGWARANGSTLDEDWHSSHARNLSFRNVSVLNLDDAVEGGVGLELTGSYSAIVENLSVATAYQGFVFRPGEALFYRPWSRDEAGAKRCLILRNIVCTNIANTGLQLKGAEDSGAGYLSVLSLDPKDETDLMIFSLDGFAVAGATQGINVSGPCDIRNGVTIDCGNGIVITDECTQFDINDVKVMDSTDIGIRASFGGALFSPARNKRGSIRNCQIKGSTGVAVSLANCDGVIIEACRFGYNTIDDGVAETTQTNAVALSTSASSVRCRSNYVATSGGAEAYASQGTSDRGNCIEDPRGATTHSTNLWQIDGVARATDTALAAAAHAINTSGKYLGKKVWDTSNNVLRIAQGATATSQWIGVDGSGAITPA